MSEQIETPPRTGRLIKILLVVSLTMNLLFIGLVVGTYWRLGSHASHDRADRLIPLVMALPRDERIALRAEFRSRLAHMPDQSGASASGRLQSLLDVLRSTPFDAEALRAHFEERVSWHENQLRAGRDALIVRIIELSDEERAAYADRLERRLDRR